MFLGGAWTACRLCEVRVWGGGARGGRDGARGRSWRRGRVVGFVVFFRV